MFRALARQSVTSTENLCGRIFVRHASLLRQKKTNTEKLIPLLDETQLFIPVVHRRHAVPLRPLNGPYKKLRSRHHIYEQIQPPKQKLPEIGVILIKDVPGKGVKGTRLSLPGDTAYAEFLAPQFAVYDNPENEKKYASIIQKVKENTLFSTITAQKTSRILSQLMVFFYMNMKTPWTVEKWHARVAFRQAGIILQEECIELPDRPINGPDPEKEGKHFVSTVIINGKERVPVLCRINHYINDEDLKLPVLGHFEPPIEPVFDEDRDKVKSVVDYRSEIIRFKF
ncbi:39S ribosomal protein L9, mitochondrial [Frankliniella fusca]|uniref:39S ribosomal protein L9, mitochondrial n=1 Tax=Frankliniella fusca TaxID=407009 RepID=A0AAE1I3C8_9NEOP|nr:39S ribosomal protein L9, mitochondrial [Frankliniella fusca]